MSLNRLPEAQNELEQTVSLDPNRATPHYLLGQIYRKQGQLDRARSEMDQFQRLKAKEPPAKIGNAVEAIKSTRGRELSPDVETIAFLRLVRAFERFDADDQSGHAYDAHGDFAKVPISNWWFNPVLALAVVSRWHAA